MGSLSVGDRIPSFTLRSAKGQDVSSDSDLLGKGPVVIYFYPKDETKGCTAQACAFRDSYAVFQDAGAEVVGISSDSESSHDSFAQHHNLPFVLLADRGGKVRKAFGVPRTMGVIPGRVTYVCDSAGVIQHVFNSQMQATRHVDEALGIVKRLSKT